MMVFSARQWLFYQRVHSRNWKNSRIVIKIDTAGNLNVLYPVIRPNRLFANDLGCWANDLSDELLAIILGGTMLLIFPHPELSGKASRIFSGFSPLTYEVFGTIQSVRGTVSFGSAEEDSFQILQAFCKILSFVCYCCAWNDEYKAMSTYTYHDSLCTTCGVSASTNTFVAEMCGLVASFLSKTDNPEAEAVALVTYLG